MRSIWRPLTWASFALFCCVFNFNMFYNDFGLGVPAGPCFLMSRRTRLRNEPRLFGHAWGGFVTCRGVCRGFRRATCLSNCSGVAFVRALCVCLLLLLACLHILRALLSVCRHFCSVGRLFGSVCLSARASICVTVCQMFLSACSTACSSIRPPVHLPVCLSVRL